MRQKQLAARRQKNQVLAQQDRANRCDYCKRAFTETGQIVESFAASGRFCSTQCLEDAAVKEYAEGGDEAAPPGAIRDQK